MLLTKDHYLSLKSGMFNTTQKTDLEQLFTALPNAAGHNKLVIHFHGGLVNMDSGLSSAEYLMEHYKDLNAYQIFFIWESGLLDVLSNSLNEISKERIFQQLLMRVTQFATAKIWQQEGERGGRLEL